MSVLESNYVSHHSAIMVASEPAARDRYENTKMLTMFFTHLGLSAWKADLRRIATTVWFIWEDLR